MSRLPPILLQDFSPDQQALFENITGGKRGAERTPKSFLTPVEVEDISCVKSMI